MNCIASQNAQLASAAERDRMRAIRTKMTIPPVMGDVDQLSQVLSNLIVNAQQALAAHADALGSTHLRELFAADPQRGGGAGQTAGGIALARSALTPTLLNPAAPLPGGRQYALHPSMTGLASLFNMGRAAVQLNVGPLVVPLTRTQYNSADRVTWPLPPKLFSHNDQQSIWQSSSPEGSTVGWGGNIGDLALGSNGNSLFTCISVTGNAVFLSGDSALSYQVSTGGAVAINSVKNNVYGSAAVKAAMATLVQQSRTNLLENEYNRVTTRAVTAESQVTAALAAYPAANAPFSTFPASNSLADQLKMVARLIAARSALGATRQVCMVSIGAFIKSRSPASRDALSNSRSACRAAMMSNNLMGAGSDASILRVTVGGETCGTRPLWKPSNHPAPG